MSEDRLDHLSRRIALASDRRAVLGALAAVPLAGAAALIGADDADARKKHDKDRKKRKKHKKKTKTLCLNGVKYKVKADKKKKINRLKKRGATPGACPAPAPVTTTAAPCASVWNYAASFGDPGTSPGDLAGVQAAAFTPDARTLLITQNSPSRITAFKRSSATSVAWTYDYLFGAEGSNPNEFGNAVDLALSVDGQKAYIADSQNKRVAIWSRPSSTSPTWSYIGAIDGAVGPPDTRPNAWGVAVSPDELTVWVAEGNNNFVSVWTRPSIGSMVWTRTTTIGGTGSNFGQMLNPTGVVVSSDTLSMWVAESDNNRVSIWTRPTSTSTNWTSTTTFGSIGNGASQLNGPYRLAISDSELVLWVSDKFNNRVSIWGRANKNSLSWHNKTTFGNSGPQRTNTPLGLGVTRDGGTVAVAASFNDKISVWTGNVCPG